MVLLKGCGHPDKAIDINSSKQKITTEEFIKRGKLIHSHSDYDYNSVDYQGMQKKVRIICNKLSSNGKPHGVFEINPDNFLAGKGCPKCGNHLSKAEDEICEYLSCFIDNSEIQQRNHTILNNKELDIYIPKYKLAIEYNGLRWHSEEFGKDKYYHLKKLEECKKQGITLIQIFEDEYLQHKQIVLNKLKHILGFSDGPKIPARKTIIKEINKREAQSFLEQFHIQGFSNSTIYLGCYYINELVAVMTFKCDNKDNKQWNLTRFASNYNYICQGIGGKIFKYFIKHFNPNGVKTFLDRRWENNLENNLYSKLGFKIYSIEKPDYTYTDGHNGNRFHKFGFRKEILHKKYNLPLSMTEKEMTKKLGYYKIWNCGLIKYIWKCGQDM